MPVLSRTRRALEVILGVALFALVLRTFVATGLVEPVVVHGSSMAPALWGERLVGRCPNCDAPVTVGIDQTREIAELECPACDSSRIRLSEATRLPADNLWVDRLAASPNRWQPIILRCPHDAQSLSVKRVVGLPGEKVEFRQGDLWVNGERCVKPLAAQLKLRRLEHLERDRQRRWAPRCGAWRWVNGAWQVEVLSSEAPAQLVYERPVYDDFTGNPLLTRRFNPQRDLMIEVEVRASPDGVWEVGVGGNRARFESGERRVLLSVFDSQSLLAVDGELAPEFPGTVEPAVQQAEGASPLIRVLAGRVRLESLTLWKDVYYEPYPQASGSPGDQPWRLGPDEFFVVGDNQAVSLDSRNWPAGPGVPERLVLGGVIRP